MAFVEVAANTLDAAFNVDNSCRFGGDTDLKRLPSSTGSSLKATMSVWVKFCTDNTDSAIAGGWDNSGANDDDGYWVLYRQGSTGRLLFEGGTDTYLRTNAEFRDLSAWYHIVLAIDSTQNDNNAQRLYINGVELTSFAARSNLTNLQDLPMNTTAGNDDALLIGCDENTGGKGSYFNGYMSEFFWIDGTQYAASDFGEFNDNGVWIPKKGSDIVSDLTMGTNGVYLEFKETGTSANSSGIGADTGGNNLHFTVTNLTAQDITTDTCTNNFATCNPIAMRNGSTDATHSFSEGNTKITTTDESGVAWTPFQSTFYLSSGKWYFEAKKISGYGGLIGVLNGSSATKTEAYATYLRTNNGSLFQDGGNESSSSSSGISDNDIVGVALNIDDEEVTFYVNGSSVQDDYAFGSDTKASGTYIPLIFIGDATVFEMNYGNPPFSISSGNADANGYGNFEYAVPSGYYALCTKNLAEFG